MDIFGQSVGLPIWQLLGGAARDRIKTYNTCGGPATDRIAQLDPIGREQMPKI
ncbi:MAG: hypothetical protein R2845_08190 [Thermomicrobiales bacterium]